MKKIVVLLAALCMLCSTALAGFTKIATGGIRPSISRSKAYTVRKGPTFPRKRALNSDFQL